MPLLGPHTGSEPQPSPARRRDLPPGLGRQQPLTSLEKQQNKTVSPAPRAHVLGPPPGTGGPAAPALGAPGPGPGLAVTGQRGGAGLPVPRPRAHHLPGRRGCGTRTRRRWSSAHCDIRATTLGTAPSPSAGGEAGASGCPAMLLPASPSPRRAALRSHGRAAEGAAPTGGRQVGSAIP